MRDMGRNPDQSESRSGNQPDQQQETIVQHTDADGEPREYIAKRNADGDGTASLSPSYEDLGIFPDTWACVARMTEKDARGYSFELLAAGVDIRMAQDDDHEHWHIAVQGGLSKSPLAWVVGIRGAERDKRICSFTEAPHRQHPMDVQVAPGG